MANQWNQWIPVLAGKPRIAESSFQESYKFEIIYLQSQKWHQMDHVACLIFLFERVLDRSYEICILMILSK